jgi:hypothetical protein
MNGVLAGGKSLSLNYWCAVAPARSTMESLVLSVALVATTLAASTRDVHAGNSISDSEGRMTDPILANAAHYFPDCWRDDVKGV